MYPLVSTLDAGDMKCNMILIRGYSEAQISTKVGTDTTSHSPECANSSSVCASLVNLSNNSEPLNYCLVNTSANPVECVLNDQCSVSARNCSFADCTLPQNLSQQLAPGCINAYRALCDRTGPLRKSFPELLDRCYLLCNDSSVQAQLNDSRTLTIGRDGRPQSLCMRVTHMFCRNLSNVEECVRRCSENAQCVSFQQCMQ